jgi:hypothetical protein
VMYCSKYIFGLGKALSFERMTASVALLMCKDNLCLFINAQIRHIYK